MVLETAVLPIRAAQLFLALLTLGLSAYVASSNNLDFFGYHYSFGQVNFIIFNSVITLLAVVYLVVAPRRFPQYTHKIALVAIDAVLTLFWFSGFIALAVITPIFFGSVLGAAGAASAFGAFEWLLFLASTVITALTHFHTGFKSGNANANPEVAPV